MNAALASDKDADFETEAVTLNLALAFAKQHDPQGQRPPLTRAPLIVAYVELEKKDLWQPVYNEGLRIDVGHLDDRIKDYIDSIADYGHTYFNRWQAHSNDASADKFKQSVRLLGAEYSLRAEIALRQKLVADDEDGLAHAHDWLAFVLAQDDRKAGEEEFNEAVSHMSGALQRVAVMPKMSALFGVTDTSSASAEQSATVDEVSFLLEAGRNEVQEAYASLDEKSDQSFAAQLEHASKLYDEIARITSDVKQFWPRHPFFGQLDYSFAWLYHVEFMLAKAHPDRYEFPDSLEKAKQSYDTVLPLLEYSAGPNSDIVRAAASDYANLLVEANLPDEAKKIEDHYGVAQPK